MKYILILLLASITLTAKDFTVSSNIGATLMQQQIKDEVGGQSNPVLFNYSEVNLNLEVSYNINEYLSAGAYYRYDFGNRQNSSIVHTRGGVDVYQTANADYIESWVGPIVKGHYKDVFLGLGYGLLATRNDSYIEIPDQNIGAEALTTSSIAWLVQIGGQFELSESLDLNIMVEYRVRYYDKLDGSDIVGGYVIGTQNFTPMIGVSYNFDL